MQVAIRSKAAVLPAVPFVDRYSRVAESDDTMRERFLATWGAAALEDARTRYPNDVILALAFVRFEWTPAECVTGEGDALLRSHAERELLASAKPEQRLAWDMLVAEGHTTVAEIKAARDEWAESIREGIRQGRREGLAS